MVAGWLTFGLAKPARSRRRTSFTSRTSFTRCRIQLGCATLSPGTICDALTNQITFYGFDFIPIQIAAILSQTITKRLCSDSALACTLFG